MTPLTCLLVLLFGLRFGYSRRVAVTIMLLYGFSTLAFTYATNYFQHPLESFLLLLSVYLLFINRDRLSLRSAFIAGVPLGLAILTRVNVSLTAPIIAIYVFFMASRWDGQLDHDGATGGSWLVRLIARIKRPFEGIPVSDWWSITVVRCVVGYLFVPTLALLTCFSLNYYRWGHIQDPTFKNVDNGPLGILVGLYGNLISPGRSIFLYSPPLILALLGIRRFYRRFPSETWLFGGISLVYVLLYAIPVEWDGGWSFGPRYLLALVPLLLLPIGEFLRSPGRLKLAALVGLLGLGIQILGSTINVSYVYWDWINMHLVPANSYLYVPEISAIPTHFHDLFAGKYVDMWLVWVDKQFGLAAVFGVLAIAVSILTTGLYLLVEDTPREATDPIELGLPLSSDSGSDD